MCDWVCLSLDRQWETHAVPACALKWKQMRRSALKNSVYEMTMKFMLHWSESLKHLTGLIIIRRMSQTVYVCLHVAVCLTESKQCLPEICFKTGLKLRMLGETEIERQVRHLSTWNTTLPAYLEEKEVDVCPEETVAGSWFNSRLRVCVCVCKGGEK